MIFPCIVIPHDYDQFDFAARIEHSKIGVRSKKINSKKTVNALKKLLSDENLIHIEKMNNNMQKYNPVLELEKEIFRLLNLVNG